MHLLWPTVSASLPSWPRAPRVAALVPALLAATLVLGASVPAGIAEAQPAGKVRHVGWVAFGAESPSTSAVLEAFREGMRERGWREGQNLVIEPRWGGRDQARAIVADLVRRRVDVIVTVGPMVFGAQAEAGGVPVVFGFSGEPVEAGLVASLGRPGGNLTGVTFLAFELVRKRLELLKEILPGLSRIAILANVLHPGEQTELRESQIAARQLGLTVQYVPVRAVGDFPAAFQEIAGGRAQAIVAFPDVLIMAQAKAIAEFAAKHRIPAISGWAEFAVDGNLMTYGPHLRESWRYLAGYVDKVLKGARPADLPVEQASRFELVVNLRTARALGLTIPLPVLLRADRAIE